MNTRIQPIDALELLKDFIGHVESNDASAPAENSADLPLLNASQPPTSTLKKRKISDVATPSTEIKRRRKWTPKEKAQIVNAHLEGGQRNMQIVANNLGMSISLACKIVSEFKNPERGGAETLFDHRYNSKRVYNLKVPMKVWVGPQRQAVCQERLPPIAVPAQDDSRASRNKGRWSYCLSGSSSNQAGYCSKEESQEGQPNY
jgi:transposase-like protein